MRLNDQDLIKVNNDIWVCSAYFKLIEVIFDEVNLNKKIEN